MCKRNMDFDEILLDVGEFGRYQKLLLAFVVLPGFAPCGFQALNQVLMSLHVEHWCLVPELRASTLSLSASRELSSAGRCYFYDVNYTSLLQDSVTWTPNASWPVTRCKYGWEYHMPHGHKRYYSIISDWDLVCEHDWLHPFAMSVFAISGLVGNWIFGLLQEWFGRRPCFFIYLLILEVFGVCTSFAPNFPIWLVCRVGVGFTVPAILATPFVLCIELVGPSRRTLATVLTNMAYSLSLVLLAAVAFWFKEWPQLALATTLPFLPFFLFWWVLPESPRWLLAHSKFEDAANIIRKIGDVNGKPLPPDYMLAMKRRFQLETALRTSPNRKPPNRRPSRTFHLLKTPNLRRKTTLLTLIWFSTSCIYVGLSYYSVSLPKDPHINFFLSAVSEMPAYLFLTHVLSKWGRRATLALSLAIGSVCLTTIAITQSNSIATLGMFCISKMCICTSFVALPLLAVEIYPSAARGRGLALGAISAMAAPIIIPYINYLGDKMMILPLMVMAALMMAALVGSLALPETLNQRLPVTLQDAEEFGKFRTISDYFSFFPTEGSSSTVDIFSRDEHDDESENRAESPLRSLIEQQECRHNLDSDTGSLASAAKTLKVTVV